MSPDGDDRGPGERRESDSSPKSDDTYHSVFIQHPRPTFIVDEASLRIVDVNEAACTLYGWTRDELLSMTILEIRPPEEVDAAREYFLEQGNDPSRRHASRHCTRDGRSLEVEETSNYVMFRGRPARIAMIDDLTERNRLRHQLEASERRYRSLFANSYDSVILCDALGTILYASPSTASVLGFTESEIVGQSSFRRIHPDDIERVTETLEDLRRNPGGSVVGEYRVRHRSGEWLWLEGTLTNLLHEPAVSAIVLNYRDVTDRKMAELALRESEDRLRSIAETAGEWIWSIDLRGVIRYSSRACESILGYTVDEVVGRSSFSFFRESDRDAARRTFEESVREGCGWTNLVQRLQHRNGSERFVETSAVPLRDENGTLTGFRGADRDITDRRLFEMKVSHQAFHDTLTDLPNRRLFTDRLTVALARAARHRSMIAVLFVDLDHFKMINDTLGHHIGDEVLKIVADRLRGIVRAADSLARVGGDEFLVVISDVTDSSDAAAVASKMRVALSEAIEIDGHRLFVSASIGISVFPDDGVEPEQLIRSADNAMYRAKESGRNAIQLFRPEMNERYADRLAIETGLRDALGRNEFVLHYQPIHELANREVAGVEALIRWHHPERGLQQPETFIPIAEQTRLILPVGRWILESACRDAARWIANGHSRLRVSVNLSARQIESGELVADIDAALASSGLDPSRLELEITESVAMQHAEQTLTTLHALKSRGVRLAVDDFGTGYSSLLYLTRFPIDTLKIDRGFVRAITHGGSDAAVVAAVLALARSLNLHTVAEGVESEEQAEFLLRHGCAEMQGYYLSYPSPSEELESLLRKR